MGAGNLGKPAGHRPPTPAIFLKASTPSIFHGCDNPSFERNCLILREDGGNHDNSPFWGHPRKIFIIKGCWQNLWIDPLSP